MYLSESEVYKKFFIAVKKAVTDENAGAECEADIYTQISKVKGMVDMTDEMLKEEKE